MEGHLNTPNSFKLARLDVITQCNHSNTEIRADCKTKLKKQVVDSIALLKV